MLHRLVAVVLLSLLVAAPVRTAFAQSNPSQDDPNAQKVKSKLREIGVGEKARVVITIGDRPKLKGYVSAIDADAFTVRTKDQDRTIVYSEVKSVRKAGKSRVVVWAVVGVMGFVITGLVVNDAQHGY